MRLLSKRDEKKKMVKNRKKNISTSSHVTIRFAMVSAGKLSSRVHNFAITETAK